MVGVLAATEKAPPPPDLVGPVLHGLLIAWPLVLIVDRRSSSAQRPESGRNSRTWFAQTEINQLAPF
jgi:hypothetical protein